MRSTVFEWGPDSVIKVPLDNTPEAWTDFEFRYGRAVARSADVSIPQFRQVVEHGGRRWVNAISPAFIGPGAMWDRQVELQARANSQYFPSDAALVAEQMIDSIPLRRVGSTGEVADVVAYLLSDASSYVTGSNIEINGGAA